MYIEDEIHGKILEFVSDHKACLACPAWKEFLYESLQLEPRTRFNKKLSKGGVVFSYNAVRPLGGDFEESVSYNFEFASDHTYVMQWTRTFDAWTSQSEQQFGCWKIDQDQIMCETLEPDRDDIDREVRFAPPGYKYGVAIEDILNADGRYFQEKIGAEPKDWEITARTGRPPYEDEDKSRARINSWQPTDADDTPSTTEPTTPTFRMPLDENARFVDIDGEMHEVSGDIVASWPEADWERLMRCRLRFGING